MSIGSFAFGICRGVTDITIPDSVTVVGEGAFYDCSGLTSIMVSINVTTVAANTFSGCSKLTKIEFNGTIAQWNDISKISGWNSNTGNYTVYCTDGTLSKS